jgi:BlaI family penicillinase repressor
VEEDALAKPQEQLSWRERQVLDALLELGEASVKEVRQSLPDPPGYSAVRALLAKLERKGLAHHRERGMRYVYAPAVSREEARESALSRLVRVFFDGSAAAAVTGIVEISADALSDEELDQLESQIAAARKRR